MSPRNDPDNVEQAGQAFPISERAVRIELGDAVLTGDVALPQGATAMVLFAHGSGSSRSSPRNRHVASVLQHARIATLLFDLLTPAEERIDVVTRQYRFDIALLAERLVGATEWLAGEGDLRALRVGYFGASTGSAAALIAAARLGERIGAVVSRGGRPDLADAALSEVGAPTLLIVGGTDDVVIGLNERALARLNCIKELAIVPGASHLFEEAGALESVARLASAWFSRHLAPAGVADDARAER